MADAQHAINLIQPTAAQTTKDILKMLSSFEW
jgi:uncharacterized protein YegP (UPF0339 family)